jgi:hypothetical protein
MITDKDFVDYQNLVQQRFEAMEAQMRGLMDTVDKQAVLVKQLVDGTPTHGVTIINVKGDKAKSSALSEIKPISKEDLK